MDNKINFANIAVPELMLADLQHECHSYADVLKKATSRDATQP